jgi:two-component system chemotaxis sensor kinase CheA
MIFEAFRQADGTTSRKYGGTGLGLSISKELAALLGGTIGLVSEEGKGSTFILRIPLTEVNVYKRHDVQAYAESAAASEPFPTLSGQAVADVSIDKADDVKKLENRTVLLVDDDMRNIFALTGVLESFGMNVIFAENGREGLKMLERYPDTDLVLMDIMMPQMDGYEAIKAIRQSGEKYSSLPIIALTAKAMKDDRDKCLEAGANDYISKPVRYEQLLSLLRVWLHR